MITDKKSMEVFNISFLKLNKYHFFYTHRLYYNFISIPTSIILKCHKSIIEYFFLRIFDEFFKT